MVIVAVIGTGCAAHAQTAAKDLAAQLREQGFACEEPVSVAKNVRRSKPDEAVWIVKCRNTAYRMRLVPDMAAHVTKLKSRH
jgi:hypothetical protein